MKNEERDTSGVHWNGIGYNEKLGYWHKLY